MKHLPILLLTASVAVGAQAGLPPGYWLPDKTSYVLSQMAPLRLAPDLSGLTANERTAVDELIAVGRIFQDLYELARHPEALRARQAMEALDRRQHSEATRNLLTLYRLNDGPIASDLEGGREPFAPVVHETAGRNVYPPGIEKTEVEAFLRVHPEARASILDERTIVRWATADNVKRDREALRDTTLRTLHPDVAAELDALAKRPDPKRLYAVPQAVAWAGPLRSAYGHLLKAAAAVEPDDAEFAGYLRNRARDLLTNDYESGDAAWVTGRFKRLNAVIGSYESYQDGLYGAKAFPEVSLLLTDEAATRGLRDRIRSIQSIEDALPYDAHKRVREDIPVGIYDIIADFGHARGTNTATILPNSSLHARRYGRTILLRRNIMENADLFAVTQKRWQGVVDAVYADHLTPSGQFQRTLWHEIGHYLGADRDKQGRPVDVALAEHADAMEEMKADLVSLFSLHAQAKAGALTANELRAVQAGGIMRTLQLNKPRPDQPYSTMQLSQFNYFLEKGLLEVDGAGRLRIHADRYETTVTSLLREVLALQHGGDPAAAEAFFRRWTTWTDLHQRIATTLKGVQGPRFRLVRYAALGE
jgi:hypothetical protein